MLNKGVLALAGAASLLMGSTVAAAQSPAASLSVADTLRASAPMAEASAQDDDDTGISSGVIGVVVVIAIVVGIYFLAESDDPVVSA
jgi:hypothetical protein